MRSIVATFADVRQAKALLGRLRTDLALGDEMASMGTVAAFGEPHDGHRVIAAWVPADREEEVQRWIAELGGSLHPQPASSTPIALAPDTPSADGKGVPFFRDGRDGRGAG